MRSVAFTHWCMYRSGTSLRQSHEDRVARKKGGPGWYACKAKDSLIAQPCPSPPHLMMSAVQLTWRGGQDVNGSEVTRLHVRNHAMAIAAALQVRRARRCEQHACPRARFLSVLMRRESRTPQLGELRSAGQSLHSAQPGAGLQGDQSDWLHGSPPAPGLTSLMLEASGGGGGGGGAPGCLTSCTQAARMQASTSSWLS